jgi:hypothetical protein
MQSVRLSLEIVTFGFALWLGLYLISRNLADVRLRFAGLGLVAYAIGLCLDTLIVHAAESPWLDRFVVWQRPFLFLPALFWVGLLAQIIPGEIPLRARIQRHPKPLGLLFTASLFFGLGLALMLFPLEWLPRTWVMLGLGIDLLLLGLAVAILDAFDEGEALAPHFFRSLDYAFITSLLFGGQVALVMALNTGVTLPMLGLLFSTITAAILIQTFSDVFQKVLDGIAFFNFPRVRQTRAELQSAASAISRVNSSLDLEALDEVEFARLTRRALSYLGNLPKLAASPLAQMPLVEERLARNGMPPGTLERANELKAILSESIMRLKPHGQGDFGLTDEWRYYNALHFPYVLGLKPYSRRIRNDDVDMATQKALEWFRTEIPQRTLYNWQNAAAKLVAQDLRERTRNKEIM